LRVLGSALVLGARAGGEFDRPSLLGQLALVIGATLIFLIPAVPSWSGNSERHSLAVLTAPVAAILLLLYVGFTTLGLRRQKRLHKESGAGPGEGWPLATALAVLGGAAAGTGVVCVILVSWLHGFVCEDGVSGVLCYMVC